MVNSIFIRKHLHAEVATYRFGMSELDSVGEYARACRAAHLIQPNSLLHLGIYTSPEEPPADGDGSGFRPVGSLAGWSDMYELFPVCLYEK